MSRACWCGVAIVLAACSSSDSKPAPSQHYRDGGIAFDYPAGWSAAPRTSRRPTRSLIIKSTSAALVIIDVKTVERAMSLRAYADSFGALMRTATPIGKMGASTFSNIEHVEGLDILVEHFTLSLLNVDVPHTRTYGRMTGSAGVCFLTSQTADNEKESASAGFEEIFETFECGAPNGADSALLHAH